MGEIAEALRRAHAERARNDDLAPDAEPAPREPQDDVYSESARRHEEAQPAAAETKAPGPVEPSPPAPRPESREAGTSPRPDTDSDLDTRGPGIRLSPDGEEARITQGVLLDEGGAVTDACLQLALRVRQALQVANARTLVVASAMRDEGKTTVSCNLALALASLGQVEGVALVDLDLRRPSLATVLELPKPACGVEDVLAAGQPLEHARVRISSPAIDVYPCLRGQLKAHEILLLPAFEQMLSQLKEQYEIVVLDSPPTLLVPDATIIMQHADCYAPVARAGVTRARGFKKMLEILPRKALLGAILDGGAPPIRKMYYERYSPDPEDLDG